MIKIKDKSLKIEGQITLKEILYNIREAGNYGKCFENSFHDMRFEIDKYLDMIEWTMKDY